MELRAIPRLVVIQVIAVGALTFLFAGDAWSASYKVPYNFNSANAGPSSGLIVDGAGNAYGTTAQGGNDHSGTVYELSPTTGYHLLFAFSNAAHGGKQPQGNLAFDSAGNLYGTTVYGGTNKAACNNRGCGVVFELSPPSNGGLWTETVLYSFCSEANCEDGANPQTGVVFDSTGNIYGTTMSGGNQNALCQGPGCGTVFELQFSQSGWTESILYKFMGNGVDGANPLGGLVFENTGILYGTVSSFGPLNGGSIFQLSPSEGTWVFEVIYAFNGFSGSKDGLGPEAGLVFDSEGNLYGTTLRGGAFGSGEGSGFGTVFELSPGTGGWTEKILYSFAGSTDGAEPESSVVLDSSGNLYGTTFAGGEPTGCSKSGCGTVYKLAPNQGGQWTESIFRFPVDGALGLQPAAPLILDAGGKVYGTTTKGGRNGDGVMFQIIP